MSTDTKRARDIADRLEDYDKYVDACDDAASMLRALADKVERLQMILRDGNAVAVCSEHIDEFAQVHCLVCEIERLKTEVIVWRDNFNSEEPRRKQLDRERDTIWKPLLEVAELADEELKHKRGGSCLVCDAIHAAREAMGEEK